MSTLAPETKSKLRSRLLSEEGYRQFLYTDTTGHVSCGIGRNFTQVGLSLDESLMLLDNDIMACERNLMHYASWYAGLCDARKSVVLDMTFQLGIGGVLAFRLMIAAIINSDYTLAATCMMDSKWAKQAPSRAKALSHIMETGIL